jgi:hypothetical protein
MQDRTRTAAGDDSGCGPGTDVARCSGPMRSSVREQARGAVLAAATSFTLSVLATLVLALVGRAAG